MKIKTKIKNTSASEKLLQEYERVMKLEEAYTQKQLDATSKLEKLLQRKQELDAEYVSALDPVEIDRLGKVRRDLYLAIQDQEMLVSIDVAGEIRKQFNAIKQYNNAAQKEYEEFMKEATGEMADMENEHKAFKEDMKVLMGSHPFNKANRLFRALIEKIKR